MVALPSGRLTTGATPPDADRALAADALASVPIEPGLSMGRYEVTRAQFARFVKESGYAPARGCFVWEGGYIHDATRSWRNPGFKQRDDEPVVCVNWNDAQAYTQWLSKISGKHYRLPTEVEWEYAARAGVRNAHPWNDAAEACRHANVADASAKRGMRRAAAWIFHVCDDGRIHTAPVGSYRANAFGLYDMLGNAWEWTADCLDAELSPAPESDAKDAAKGACSQRLLRGGSWVDSPPFVSFEFRFMIGAGDRDFYAGFRVARIE